VSSLKSQWAEILMARRVEQVEDEPLVLEAHHRRGDRDAALALDRHPIRARPPPLALLPIVVRREVNSYTAGLDDPQRAFRRPRTEHGEELSYAIEEGGMCGPRPDLEHHYAGAAGGRISKHLPNPRALNRRSVASDARGAIHCDPALGFQPRTLQTMSRPPRLAALG
jgi:hypothetical protein